ncbi:hypothetical protein ACOME3_010644 [Neoechinorhynchus agilis]
MDNRRGYSSGRRGERYQRRGGGYSNRRQQSGRFQSGPDRGGHRGRGEDQGYHHRGGPEGFRGRGDNRGRFHGGVGSGPRRQQFGSSMASGNEIFRFTEGIAKQVILNHTFKQPDFESFDICQLGTDRQSPASISTAVRKMDIKKPIKVMINYYPFIKLGGFFVSQYDVIIEDASTRTVANDPNNFNKLSPLRQRMLVQKALLKISEHQNPDFRYRVIYDGGRIVYALNGCLNGEDKRSVFMQNRYRVVFEKTADIDMKSDTQMVKNADRKIALLRPQLAVIDTITKTALSCLLESFGRSFFPINEPPVHRLDPLMGLFKGIFASAVVAFDALALNVDVANAVLAPEISLLEYFRIKGYSDADVMCDSTNSRTLERMSDLVFKERKKVVIKYNAEGTHKRFGTFHSLNIKSPYQYEFSLDKDDNESKKVTVAQYFKKQYNYDCSRQYVSVATGGDGHAIVPIELVYLASRKVPNEELRNYMADVIKKTALPPCQRMNEINSKNEYFRSKMSENSDCGKYLRAWNIEVSDRMAVVKAGILPIPQLFHQNGQISYPRATGSWYGGQNFSYFPGTLTTNEVTWSYYIFPGDRFINDDTVQRFLYSLTDMARKCGIRLAQNGHCHQWPLAEFNVEFPRYILSGHATKLTFFFSRQNSMQYQGVKAAAELVGGVVTQFITDKALNKRDRSGGPDGQVIANICHKLCAKLGGINLSLNRAPASTTFSPNTGNYGRTMFIGLDVTHHALKSKGLTSRVSIAAVVASVDFVPHSYITEISLQKNPRYSRESVEIVYNMQTIMRRILVKYRERNNCLPDRIIVYRDGVSDGQLGLVNRFEVNGIIEACRKEGMQNNVFLSVIVVQKRHHLRMFPVDRNDADRNGNPLPGTVYAQEICMDSKIDAFLVSHAGIQGTSRPTRYRLIYDSIGFSENDLMQLTFNLCHLYAKCFRSVSIPAPCYYAHHVAFRARHYVEFAQICDQRIWDYLYEDALQTKPCEMKKKEGSPVDRKLKFLVLSLNDRLSGKLYFC